MCRDKILDEIWLSRTPPQPGALCVMGTVVREKSVVTIWKCYRDQSRAAQPGPGLCAERKKGPWPIIQTCRSSLLSEKLLMYFINIFIVKFLKVDLWNIFCKNGKSVQFKTKKSKYHCVILRHHQTFIFLNKSKMCQIHILNCSRVFTCLSSAFTCLSRDIKT